MVCEYSGGSERRLTYDQLNDVISLLVGLWAVRVADRSTESKMYTYGVSLNSWSDLGEADNV